MIAQAILGLTDNAILILLIINIFLLIVGMFIDNIPATIILTPILLPICTGVGMHPVTFGIMLTMNLAIGFCSPPYGINPVSYTHLDVYKRQTYNCTPYIDTNVPMYKEVIAFSESSATPYVNSVWGARSNREGANSALCAAVTGFVPEYGLLLDENRKGNILVEVQADMKLSLIHI